MRPRRKVALYSQNEQSLGVLACLLRLRLHIELSCCSTAAEAALAGCDLTILVLDSPEEKTGLQNLCAGLHGSSLLCDPKRFTSETECDATAYQGGPVMPAHLLDTVRALLTQRRGPKPKARKNSTLPAISA